MIEDVMTSNVNVNKGPKYDEWYTNNPDKHPDNAIVKNKVS